jgi:DNA-binding Lrp family transcriptional regulator
MKEMVKKLLSELLKNSRRSDRELSKVLGVSQATVTRMRNNLVRDGVIREFTIIPNFGELGYELFAISSVRTKVMTEELVKRAEKWVKQYPNVVLMAAAEGGGKTGVIVSLHKNYTDYSRFVSEARMYWGEQAEDYDTLLVSLKGMVAKPFSLRSLAEALSKSED